MAFNSNIAELEEKITLLQFAKCQFGLLTSIDDDITGLMKSCYVVIVNGTPVLKELTAGLIPFHKKAGKLFKLSQRYMNTYNQLEKNPLSNLPCATNHNRYQCIQEIHYASGNML
jgi:hypothetical protein